MNRRSFLKWIGLGSVASVVGGGAWAKVVSSMNPYYKGPIAKNFDGTIFFNPNGVPPGDFRGLLKWQLFESKAKWPEQYLSPFANAKPVPTIDDDVSATMIGHATFLIQTGGINFLTDPVFSERASPFQFAGPKRKQPPGVAIADLPKIDVILLSHNHYDHFDMRSLEQLVDRDNPLIVTPLGNDAIILKAIKHARTKTGNWDDVVSVGNGVDVHFEPMHHWSARAATDRRMALWAAFVIAAPAGKTYIIGDTGFHDGINYRAAAEKHGRFKLAIIPVGAYNPRWFMQHMHQNPEEAVQGHILCNAETSIAHHWGTFQLTNEPIEEPIERLAQARVDQGVGEEDFIVLLPGQEWRASVGVQKNAVG